MEIVELPLDRLKQAGWNPNSMNARDLARLQESITRYGWVVPLVVRPQTDGVYEVLSGNQRLTICVADGTSMRIPRDWTDADGESPRGTTPRPFTLASLRQLMQLVDALSSR